MRNIKNLALFVLLPALMSTAAVADIHYVNPGESIQAAIVAADPGDEIVVAPGTYYEAIDFIGKPIRLYSSVGPYGTTIDGTGHYHVVQCVNSEGPDTILEGFTITGAKAKGTGVDGCGGGMLNDNSSPTVSKCTFTGNTANEMGGGMYNNNSSPTVTDCTFSGNTATSNAGGMRNSFNSSPTVTNCNFSGNTAYSGGGMSNYDNSSPTVTDCTFSGNTATSNAGGMRNSFNSSPTVTNCNFSGNTAERGGGMYNTRSSPTVADCSFIANNANNEGGGMYNSYSNPTVTDCTFEYNIGDYGGGMYNEPESSPTVTNCIFLNNMVALHGGGMYNHYESDPNVTGCTFSGNTANNEGGGMYNYDSSPTVTNCTFTVNTASQGGGMYNLTSTPTLANCILWDDSPDEIFDDVDSFTTVTYSDVQGDWAGTGNFDICPLFTDVDRRLSPYSPCIDAGNDAAVPPGVTTDLDGNPRIQGVCVDMGAFETEFIVIDFSGWVWMESGGDFGYSYNEDDLLYFLSFGPVWYYNTATSLWGEEGPVGWTYVNWPFLYESDTSTTMFALPPADGLWVYHFRTSEWTVSPQIIP